MKYLIRCNNCLAVAWIRGDYEPDTNAFVQDENKEIEWEAKETYGCTHEEWEVIEEESEDE